MSMEEPDEFSPPVDLYAESRYEKELKEENLYKHEMS